MVDNTAGGVRPLDGVKIVEFMSIGPAPFAAMILADFGADVILIERPGGVQAGLPMEGAPFLSRGKRSVILDLADPSDKLVATELVRTADVVVEGFRPGVLERLGLGPEQMNPVNPGLIYARLSGWGQSGPLALSAGHDINYIALAGPLHQVGKDVPTPPAAFVGDLAGGSLTLALGVLLALQARNLTGRGQVVDGSILDGSAQLMAPLLELHHRGYMGPRGSNLVDGMAPFYRVYETLDGKFFSVGAVEGKFYASLLEALGFADVDVSRQFEMEDWPALRERFSVTFLSKTRDEWTEALCTPDQCCAPVLDIPELTSHEHLVARGLFWDSPQGIQSRPSPLLPETPGRAGETLTSAGQHSTAIRQALVDQPGKFPSRSS